MATINGGHGALVLHLGPSQEVTLPATTTIDPNGDLLLIAGKEQQPILVSASAMRLASGVFRAMLGPNFKEGKGLAEHSSNDIGPYQLPLPEDHHLAMVILCKILHHKYRGENDTLMTVDTLTSLATLADKYDCVNAGADFPTVDTMQETVYNWNLRNGEVEETVLKIFGERLVPGK